MFRGFQEFLNYTRGQVRGLLALSILLLLLLAGLYWDFFFQPSRVESSDKLRAAVEAWEAEKARADSLERAALRPFDPNRMDSSFFVKTGLSPTITSYIMNYRREGGRFRQMEDLRDIYDMDTSWYNRAKKHLRISEKDASEQQSRSKATPPQFRGDDFDPNQVSAEKLQSMGLKDWQAQNILSFRQKYRPFQSPEDIFEVYGIDSALARQIIPHVRIDSAALSGNEDEAEKEPPAPININQADSAQLVEVRGIGGFTAEKVLEQREQLGGFHSLEQLIGIYPIDSARFREIRPRLKCRGPVRKLSLNDAGFEELLAHPYLEYQMVSNIVAFREDLRDFKNVEELRNIELIDTVIFRKIAPYLEIRSSAGTKASEKALEKGQED